jgi:hypothetical protein
MTLHQRQVHPEYREGCFGCKVGTARLGLARLRNDNREGMTQSERGRETIEAATAAGVNFESTKRWV